MRAKKKRKSAWDLSPGQVASAEAVLRESRRLLRRLPTEGELALLASWGEAGGPALAYWMTA
jgi:hypothetical protein